MGLMKSRSLVNKYENTSGSGHENDGHSYGDDCSICLETTSNIKNDRSPVKLRCGHQFHLDCIGSAFNAKRMMQCPNCRRVEKGEWQCGDLYNQYNYIEEDNYVEETIITEIVSTFQTQQHRLVFDHPSKYDMGHRNSSSAAPRDPRHVWIQNHEDYSQHDYPLNSYDNNNGVINYNFWGSETLLQPQLMAIDHLMELYYMTNSYGSFYDMRGI